jgi:hypothetical protein
VLGATSVCDAVICIQREKNVMVRYAVAAVVAFGVAMSTAQSGFALDGKTAGLNRRLVGLLHQIEKHYGRSVSVTSGCRSHTHNRRIGGARESFHLRCMAADIKLSGVGKGALVQYVSSLSGRGGVGLYCRDGNVHIDVGPKRNWIWRCNGKQVYTGSPAKVRVAAR